MKRLLISLFTIAASLGVAMAQSTTTETITVGGLQRKMIVHVPASLPDNAPLLITFHGFNQSPDYQMNTTDWNNFSDSEKFVVVYPEYDGGFWDVYGDKDVTFTREIIKQMNKKYKINKNRVYASGFSLGAMMTYHLINKMAKEIAAFAPVSGVRFDNKQPSGSRHVPLIHHHGSADDVFKFGGDLGHQAGGYPSITEYVTSWAKWNGCDMDNKKTETVSGDTHITWTNAKEGIETRYNIINGAGHWHARSNGTYTTQEIWNFVRRYALDGDVIGLVQKIVPSNGKTGLTNTQSFTVAFNEYMSTENATAVLKGNGQTINLVMSGNASNRTKMVKFVFDADTELTGGEYTLTIDGLQTMTGGVKGHLALNYSFEACAPTGIKDVTATAMNGKTYTLSGVRANAGAKGVLITDGKKVYVE